MSCGPHGDHNQTIFSPVTPHFFTIILEETLQENKLRIPQKFVRKYGESLSNSVFVKLSCGSKWKMELKEQDNKIWFKKGWPDFAKHYALKRGSMLIFRYEGNSEFHAFIFDASTVEIEYPSISVDVDKSNVDLELQSPKEKVVEDDYVEILDDLSPCPKRKEKSPLPCPQPHKIMRTGPTGKTQSNSAGPNECELERKPDLLPNSDKDKSTSTTYEIDEIIRHMETHMYRSEKVATLQKAIDFKSTRPFFKVIMQPSYIYGSHLDFPHDFAKRHLNNKSKDAILIVPTGGRKTWSVNYTFIERENTIIARFQSGWISFSRDNNLEVGDVCVFVLLESTMTTFRVVTFHLNGNSKSPISQAHEGGAIQEEAEEDLTNETLPVGAINDEIGNPSSLESVPAKQESGCMSTPSKTSQHQLTSTERARILDSIPFKSERPFFKTLMQPSYVGSKTDQLPLPLNFVTTYIKTQGYVVLSVPNGRSWYAELRMTPPGFSYSVARLCKGWPEFVNDNNLKVGDVCIFKLLDRDEISFEVSIVRFSEYDCLQWSQDECATRPSGGTINDEIGEPSSLDSFPAKQSSGCMFTPWKTMTYAEKSRVLNSIPFESERPFCKVVMQQTYVGFNCRQLKLPLNFVSKYVKTEGYVLLSVPNGRSWNVELKITLGRNSEAKLFTGWSEFASDNNLKVGDVCIFKLLDRPAVSFEVFITRFPEYDCQLWSQGGCATRPSGGSLNDEIGEPSSLDSFPAKQASGCMFTPWKTMTHAEKSRVLDSIPFESERPFCKVVMHQTYVGFNCRQLRLPLNFVTTYVKTEGYVVLSVPNGRSWNVELKITRGRNSEAKLFTGWPEFASGNYLKVSDVCIFKLLDRPAVSFEVFIARFPEYDCQLWSQGECSTRPSGGVINDEIGEASSLDNFPAKQATRRMSTPSKRSVKAGILDSIHFISERPFCKVLMQSIYVGRNCKLLQLPLNFVMTYIKTQGDVVLSVPDGRSWNVELRITPPSGSNCVTTLDKGWPEFANDNNLKVGDVCIFKLLDRPETSLEVSIVRFAQYDCNQLIIL
ncbi:B3 DNA binding domain containing protein [Parasponia andersonii]|uniref:B3 DNA binding domain containing protein n=1 Tax=Parasponia andersonii TaxID=3476 RepID=A0A2P5BZ33_PARAD|nr:B3 DNA binding domain containing protein [Parasponia andersonii]